MVDSVQKRHAMSIPANGLSLVSIPLPADLPETVNGQYGLLCQQADELIRDLERPEDQLLCCELASAHFALWAAVLRNQHRQRP